MLPVALVSVPGCSSTDVASTTSGVEKTVRAEYEQQLNAKALEEGVHDPINVLSVRCVDETARHYTCIADVDGALTGQTDVDVRVGHNDRIVWRTSGEGLELASDRP